MNPTSTIKTAIIPKLDFLSIEELRKIFEFVKKINRDEEAHDRLLSFAGSWQDMDKDIFDDLTINLAQNRVKDTRFDLFD